jgi:timeless
MTYYLMAIRTAFTEDDWKLVQLVLTLFRNLLAVQEITLPQKASGEATQLLFLADSFLELMFQENMMDLILVLTQHIEEPSGYLKHENLLLLEIFHYLFLGRDPELIAKVRTESSKVNLFFVTNLSGSLDDPCALASSL